MFYGYLFRIKVTFLITFIIVVFLSVVPVDQDLGLPYCLKRGKEVDSGLVICLLFVVYDFPSLFFPLVDPYSPVFLLSRRSRDPK